MATIRRLRKELQDLMAANYDVEIVDNDITKWQVALPGPDGTPYFGGTFLIEVSFPNDYPFSPPKINFATKIYHPNIDHKGNVCISILRSSEWKPTYTIVTVFQGLVMLLAMPNPDDPLVPEIAAIMMTDMYRYERIAGEWTVRYGM
jgi:ubiquitin-conjugating enzyme E2 D/E